MPFALIAVTLLLTGSVYGVVYASIENSENNTDAIIGELSALGDGINDTERFVETALGQIINNLSKTESGGTLSERISSFDSCVDKWLSSTFPIRDKGITANIVNKDIRLRAEPLKLSSGDRLTDGSVPSYLKATGTMTIDFISSTGTTEKVIDLSADGTSGLPLVIENSSKFELSLEGNQSVLTQLMSYQLSSLAQQRVLSGYGALSEGGHQGTLSIITEEDVKKAYRNALSVIETICFRNSNDDNDQLHTAEKIDIAEMMVLNNGYLEMDLSAIYAQTLMSMLDELVLQWLDYIRGDVFLDVADFGFDLIRMGFEALNGFLSGDGNWSDADEYIECVMKNAGYTDDQYRYLDKGLLSTITVNGGIYDASAGGKTTSLTIPDMNLEVPYPQTDILAWNGWNNFKIDYHFETNELLETLRNLIKTIAVNIANSSELGSIDVKADMFDDTNFADVLSSSVNKALEGQWEGIEVCIDRSIRASTVSDPMYIAMFEKLDNSQSEIFGLDSHSSLIESHIRKSIGDYMSKEYGAVLDPSVVERMVRDTMETKQVHDILEKYKRDVDDRMRLFENILTDIPNNDHSLLKLILSAIGKCGLGMFNVLPMMKGQMVDLCQSAVDYGEMNPYYGVVKLAGSNSFTLYDDTGNTYKEFMNVLDNGNLSVEITQPKNNTEKCIHYIGFEDHSITPYTSVYTIKITSNLDYSVTTSSAVLSALDTYDSRFVGNARIDTTFDIPFTSGWALTGVDYKLSTDIFNDAWKLLICVIDPLLEPLRKVFGLVKDFFDICSTAMMEITEYLTDVVMRFYEAIEVPLGMIQDFIESILQTLGNIIVKIVDVGPANQTIVFGYMGLELTIGLKLATLVKDTKSIIKITLSQTINDVKVSATVEVKQNSKDGFILTGSGFAKGGNWDFDVSLDPLMKTRTSVAMVEGHIDNIEFDARMPELVQYDSVEINASDLPGISNILSNIPLPIPGMKGRLDMGVELKYSLPMKTGLLINEFESNPNGSDDGTEWVELYNASGGRIDLDGYVLIPGSGNSKMYTIRDTTIEPWSKIVITFGKQTLNNSSSNGKNGDRLTLVDGYGMEIDQTPWKSDSSNSGHTWQRTADGATIWTFANGTPGSKNGGNIPGGVLMKAFVIECAKDAAEEAFFNMGNKIKNADDLALYFETVIELTMKKIIDAVANSIVGASVYLLLEITDYVETQHHGIRVSLETGSDLIREGLNWLVGQIGCLTKYVGGPSNTDPLGIVCENTYFRTIVYTGIGAPRFLNTLSAMDTNVAVGVSVSVNLAGVGNIFGQDLGRWKAQIGIVMENIPTILIPDIMDPDKTLKSDLWLVRLNFREME